MISYDKAYRLTLERIQALEMEEVPLGPGKLYASNLVTLAAWCLRYGYTVETFVARDDADLIRKKLVTCLQDYDAVLTSGGAWSGERDLVVRLLDELGWHKVYHRVRMGPGKRINLDRLMNWQ